MTAEFTPVTLIKNGSRRTAQTATEETELRFNGWRTAPSEKPGKTGAPAPAPKPSDSK